MKSTVIIILVIITLCPQLSYAKEIYEEERIYVYEDTDLITLTEDLSIPNREISSVDVNEYGELLICYSNKMMVFNSEYIPIKAFDIKVGRGSPPTAVWNQETGRIVYIRGDGYEINDGGKIVAVYEEIDAVDYRPKSAEKDGVIYKLENRVPLPNFISTYSTLVSLDSDGNEKVLHNAIWSQFLEQFSAIVMIVVFIIGITYLIIQEYRKSKMKKSKPYKKVYVNARPRAVLKKK